MQNLQKNNLLPPEITINDNDSITFNGKILLTETQNNLDSKLNRDIINAPQIVKRDVEKWNFTFIKTINQEQHLLSISNNSNSNSSLSREQNINIIDIKEINSILFNTQIETNYVANNVTAGV